MDPFEFVAQTSCRRIRKLSELLDNADFDDRIQLEALRALNFISRSQENIQNSRRIFGLIEPYITPAFGVPSAIVLYIIAAKFFSVAAGFGPLILSGYVMLIGYQQWIRNECTKNVEDSIARKAALNDVIRQNFNLLSPYVGQVFGISSEYSPTPEASKITVDIYIFSELDNLEFIFQKGKFGLVYPEFAYRAVKIFIARTENDRFASRAEQLARSGRYNRDFLRVVADLILVGLYRRELRLSMRQ